MEDRVAWVTFYMDGSLSICKFTVSPIQIEVFGEQLITRIDTSNGFVAERKDGLRDEWNFFY